ncbi:myosin light chain kinase, smooth muscle-like, partial [Sinocyclocheilus anshuiensis]|uniref:myosin light chain kinase, smooth muscle-like n=1 Tax=Sinocyclocheilus anshuiensis TaxID=1608454 RepID=UPI0007B86D92
SKVDEEASYEEEAKVFSTSTVSTEEDSCATSLHLKEKSKTFELQPDCKLCSEPLEKKPEKPVFVTKFSSAIATVGNTAKFTVTVSGFPRPVIQWYHNGQLIQSSSFYTFVQEKEEHSLFITNITKELEGEYSCTASNRFGKSTCTSYLHVKVKDIKEQEKTFGQPPYFIKAIEHVKYAAGSHALFEYTVAGVPLPDVQWYRGSNHMQPSKYCIVVNNTDGSGYLKILGIQQSDSGLYSCRASNPLGETSCSAELIVFLETSSEATESRFYSVSLPEQVRTSLQQGHQMIYTTSTEDRQTVTSEQTDTLHALDISAATVHLEQVTRQATVIQSHDVQERVKVAPAQPKPVVATPLKQLHMAAITSAVQEKQGFTEQHCDQIVSPEVRELELSVEEPSNFMSAISESSTPLSIVKAKDLIKSETEKIQTTSEPKFIVSGSQFEIKLPILQEECTKIKSPEEEKSYRVAEGVKLLYTAISSENVALTEDHISELATVESIECLAEKEQAKPVLTSVSETKHTLLKENNFEMHRPVKETAQLSKEPILKSALVTEEKNKLQADKTTGIPILEHPFSVHSQKEEDQVLHLQLISDQDTLLSEGRFTTEKPGFEQADVKQMPILLHTVSSDDQKTVLYEQATQLASKDTTIVVKPREEVPARIHLHSVQSKTTLCKEGLLSVEKPDEQ